MKIVCELFLPDKSTNLLTWCSWYFVLLSSTLQVLLFLGKYHCPLTYREFNSNSHIVVLRPSGNVFSFEAIDKVIFFYYSMYLQKKSFNSIQRGWNEPVRFVSGAIWGSASSLWSSLQIHLARNCKFLNMKMRDSFIGYKAHNSHTVSFWNSRDGETISHCSADWSHWAFDVLPTIFAADKEKLLKKPETA